MGAIQVPSIILPQVWLTGLEVETMNDLVAHPSIAFSAPAHLKEKNVFVQTAEFVALGVPGALWLWIEVSPIDPAISAAYWTAIGGGGGPVAPLAPVILAPTGVLGAQQTVQIPWRLHTPWMRFMAQMPVAAAPLTAHWLVQAVITGDAN